MSFLDPFLSNQLLHGRSYFSKEDALKATSLSPEQFSNAATRLIKKHRLASPWRGFYLIMRPEDRVAGAPDPVRWIDPLMKYLNLDYRISLLRAANFYGSSHQAAMVFQVLVPKQLRSFDLGRHRVHFVYQSSDVFVETNQPDWLQQLKSDAGFAKIAGIELTLLDATRYFHKVGGINGLAQIVHDLGKKADPRKLGKAAQLYENSAIRRLGYLLEHFGYERQARVLVPFIKSAKSMKPLDPSVKPLLHALGGLAEKDPKWLLLINTPVEIDL